MPGFADWGGPYTAEDDYVIAASDVEVHPKNWLNDLTAKQWLKMTRSWFTVDALHEPEWKDMKEQHVGTYPKAVPARLIQTYSKKGHTVLDPMMGTGTTLIAAMELERKAIGIELNPKYAQLTKDIIAKHYYHPDQRSLIADDPTREQWQAEILLGDAVQQIRMIDPESVHYTCFSPPYSNALRFDSKAGGILTRTQQRKEKGLDTVYSDDPMDVGNVATDQDFLDYMVKLADELYHVTVPGHYMTMVIQNFVGLKFRPFAWELALEITNRTNWEMKPEQIWTQSEKSLRIHGWPSTFLTSNHHHYCLHWRKPT